MKLTVHKAQVLGFTKTRVQKYKSKADIILKVFLEQAN